MLTLFLYYFISHVISFVCSILEAALLCCTGSYIALLKKKKPLAGQILGDLKAKIDRPLAAILTFNTAAHTFGAAGVGAQVVELYGDRWLALASVVVTLTMLFLTEMIPKTLGALYWKKLAPVTAYTVRFLIWLTYPFVVSFEAFAKVLARGKGHDKITEEEIRYVLAEGAQAGVIHETEQDMLESIFRLGDRRVGVLMTPRMEIEWLDIQDPPEDLRKTIEASSHSHFPICQGEFDKVLGIINARDFFTALATTGITPLEPIIHQPLFVPENMRVLQLLDLFKKTHNHLALVTDEYGGIQGLVTLHDVLESIVGGIPSSALEADSQVVQRKDGSWLVDGMMPIDEWKAYFDVDVLPDQERGNYRTVGGFCMRQMGAIPRVGDTFVWGAFKFKIVNMDGRRVDKILMRAQ